jgi:uncharacterized protein (TIGR02391 family)
MRPLLDRVQQFQEFLLETGLARAVLALPAPRMLSLPSPTAEGAEPASIFARLVVEPEIVAISRDLFASGHFSLAVQEAYKAVDKFVETKSGKPLSGTKLMELVFNPDSPVLAWTDRNTTSQKDEQRGYQRIYAGAMLGIRNPVTHEFDWVKDSTVALELLVLAQHLMRKAKEAELIA